MDVIRFRGPVELPEGSITHEVVLERVLGRVPPARSSEVDTGAGEPGDDGDDRIGGVDDLDPPDHFYALSYTHRTVRTRRTKQRMAGDGFIDVPVSAVAPCVMAIVTAAEDVAEVYAIQPRRAAVAALLDLPGEAAPELFVDAGLSVWVVSEDRFGSSTELRKFKTDMDSDDWAAIWPVNPFDAENLRWRPATYAEQDAASNRDLPVPRHVAFERLVLLSITVARLGEGVVTEGLDIPASDHRDTVTLPARRNREGLSLPELSLPHGITVVLGAAGTGKTVLTRTLGRNHNGVAALAGDLHSGAGRTLADVVDIFLPALERARQGSKLLLVDSLLPAVVLGDHSDQGGTTREFGEILRILDLIVERAGVSALIVVNPSTERGESSLKGLLTTNSSGVMTMGTPSLVNEGIIVAFELAARPRSRSGRQVSITVLYPT